MINPHKGRKRNKREIFLRKGGVKSTVCGQASNISGTVCSDITGVSMIVVVSITKLLKIK
jgi:hypothetical protein